MVSYQLPGRTRHKKCIHHQAIGIYTDVVAPSPTGEGWDEGDITN